jgi:hypothetical protein
MDHEARTMGMTNWPMMAGLLGGQALTSMFAPEEQEINPFEGTLDPREVLGDAMGFIGGLRDRADMFASQGVNLPSAFVQQPPTFAGGGLPIPIGLTSSDPALKEPSLLGKNTAYDAWPEMNGIWGARPGQPLRGGGGIYIPPPRPPGAGPVTPENPDTVEIPTGGPAKPIGEPGTGPPGYTWDGWRWVPPGGFPGERPSGARASTEGDDLHRAFGAVSLMLDALNPDLMPQAAPTSTPRRRSIRPASQY